MSMEEIKNRIVDIPDFPKSGVNFKDITPILENPASFRVMLELFEDSLKEEEFDSFVAIESRGFILGAALATRMDKGMILMRKPGKLPRAVESFKYDLEYGTDELQVHRASFLNKPNVVIIDDVLATGGTAHAAENLIKRVGSNVVGHRFLMELTFLKGAEKLERPHHSLLKY